MLPCSSLVYSLRSWCRPFKSRARPLAGVRAQPTCTELGLALNAYVDAHNLLPQGESGTGYSLFSNLLPHLDAGVLYNNINFSLGARESPWPNTPNWTCASTTLSALLCPSTPLFNDNWLAVTHYAGNGGYGTQIFGYNGPFIDASIPITQRQARGLAAITDGTSNTSAASEWIIGSLIQPINRDPAIALFPTEDLNRPDEFDEFVAACRAVNPLTATTVFAKRGAWIFGGYAETLLNHDLPPKGHSCTNGSGVNHGSYAAYSRHPSGVNVLFVDGHVILIRDTIGLAPSRTFEYICRP